MPVWPPPPEQSRALSPVIPELDTEYRRQEANGAGSSLLEVGGKTETVPNLMPLSSRYLYIFSVLSGEAPPIKTAT